MSTCRWLAPLVIACLLPTHGCARRRSAATHGSARQKWTTKTNSPDGASMVLIAGGTFEMGDDSSESPSEKPVHRVRVGDFWLYQYEVTNAQYRTFVEATGHRQPGYRTREGTELFVWEDDRLNEPQQPVSGVGWHDAVAYCRWAGGRLPTEAEWEYAARAGRQLDFPTVSGAFSRDLVNAYGTSGRDEWEFAAPVGSFPPNPLGLYDMAGNVYEWCSSLEAPYPYKPDDGREDPDNATTMRAMRGGSWSLDFAGYFRCAARSFFYLPIRRNYFGFRVAKTAGS